MNKKLIPVLVILLLLAGGGYYLKTKQSPAGVVDTQTDSQVISEAAEFAKAIESGKPTTCVMTKGEDSMQYHIKGKMMAANITVAVEGQSTTSHMINDSTYLYAWADGQKQGSKMSLAVPSPAVPSSTNTPEFNSVDDYDQLKDQGYIINCQAGNFNDSVFTPPATIEFIDPSVMMRAIPSPNAAGEYDMSQLEQLQKQFGGAPQE